MELQFHLLNLLFVESNCIHLHFFNGLSHKYFQEFQGLFIWVSFFKKSNFVVRYKERYSLNPFLWARLTCMWTLKYWYLYYTHACLVEIEFKYSAQLLSVHITCNFLLKEIFFASSFRSIYNWYIFKYDFISLNRIHLVVP